MGLYNVSINQEGLKFLSQKQGIMSRLAYTLSCKQNVILLNITALIAILFNNFVNVFNL